MRVFLFSRLYIISYLREVRRACETAQRTLPKVTDRDLET